jgi:hypothetical protein
LAGRAAVVGAGIAMVVAMWQQKAVLAVDQWQRDSGRRSMVVSMWQCGREGSVASGRMAM